MNRKIILERKKDMTKLQQIARRILQECYGIDTHNLNIIELRDIYKLFTLIVKK